jgi:hypothetical protein
VDKIFFEIREALVADKVLFRVESDQISALALAAQELGVLGRGESNESGEVVLAIKLEKRLKGRETGEVEGLGTLGQLDLSGLSFEDYLVLLVTGTKGERSRQLGCRDSQVTGVAKVVLSLNKG